MCNAKNKNVADKESQAKKKTEDNISPREYFEKRTAAVAALKQNPETHPYPHKFPVTISIPEFLKKYDGLQNNEYLDDVHVSLAGRVHTIRRYGSKLIFFDLHGNDAKLQVLGNIKRYSLPEKFQEDVNVIRRGDIIGIYGIPARSATGELSIVPSTVNRNHNKNNTDSKANEIKMSFYL